MTRILLYQISHSRPFRWLATIRGTLAFRAERWMFGLREWAASEHASLIVASGVLRLVMAPIVFAVAVLAGLVLLPSAMERLPYFGRLASWLAEPLTTTGHVDLLAAIATTAGAFLVLYFTTVSVVASTSYSTVPRAIRHLFVGEVVGNTYLKGVAHLTSVAAIALVLNSVYVTTNRLIVLYCVGLAVVMVFAFIPLGRHIFELFDIRKLAAVPCRDFAKWLSAATVSSPRAHIPSFQRFFHDRAARALSDLDDLIAYAASEPHVRSQALTGFASMLLGIIRTNSEKSSQIPSDSLWFERLPTFQPWTLMDMFQTGIALKTTTLPQPKDAPDHSSITRKTVASLAQVLQTLLAMNRHQDVAELTNAISRTAESLAHHLALEDAIILLKGIEHDVLHDLVDRVPADDHTRKAAIATVGALATAHLGVFLALASSLRQRVADKAIHIAVTDLRRRTARHLYCREHPREVLTHQEALYNRVHFEHVVEGRVISPEWFLEESVARCYCDYLAQSLTRLVDRTIEFFDQAGTQLQHATESLCRAAMIHDGLQTLDKIVHNMAPLCERYEELSARAVAKEDWHRADLRALASRLATVRKRLLLDLAMLMPALPACGRSGKLPDYLGFARAIVGDELCGMMAQKNMSGFDVMFGAYFRATLAVYDVQVAEQAVQGDTRHSRIALDMLLDLLELSGLAVLFADLHGTGFGNVVISQWDAYFAALPQPDLFMRVLLAALDSRSWRPVLTPGSNTRFEWERLFLRAMKDAGLSPEGRFVMHGHGVAIERPSHSSAVIRSVQSDLTGMFISPYSCFGAVYLAGRPEAANVTLPSEVVECQNDIQRQMDISDSEEKGDERT